MQANLIGLKTLYMKEVRRFLKVYNQTLLAPVITALLFLAIFNLAMAERIHDIGGVPFGNFMAAGLIMMAVMQNAFANTSSSFIMGKVLGTLIDYLMPPISAGEIVLGMVGAAVTRGVLVGICTGLAISIFVPLHIHDFSVMLFYIVSASILMALMGMFAGIIAGTFDQMAAVTSYIVTPLAFLSGTFYSVDNLPGFWHDVTHYNPFFYMIDGFRFGLTGYHDGSLMVGAVYITITNLLLALLVHSLLARGYRVKD